MKHTAWDIKHEVRNTKHEAYDVPCFMFHVSCERGFALVELLVALAIFGIVTTFVLLAYRKVNNELRTTSLAYEVALSFREAQSYGVSVRAEQAGKLISEELDSAYGLHFEQKSEQDSQSKNYYVLFVDKKRDKETKFGGETLRYDGSEDASGCISAEDSECVSIFKIGEGNFIKKFCGVKLDGGIEECNTSTNFPITELDVSFQRPNPDAIIETNLSYREPNRYKGAKIYLNSGQDIGRTVEVGTAGQISIK